MKYIFLVFALSWLCTNSAVVLAQSNSDLPDSLAKLEMIMFGKSSTDQALQDRLRKLELATFGIQQKGGALERLGKLQQALTPLGLPQPSNLKTNLEDSGEDASGADTATTSDASAERKLLKSGVTKQFSKSDANSGILLRANKPKAAPKLKSTKKLEATEVVSEKEQFCGHWIGNLSGNDRNASIIVDLECLEGNRLTGTLLWTSNTSGTNKRQLSGFYDLKTRHIVMHDVGLLYVTPKPGWFFCAIENYQLRLSQDAMEIDGTYTSKPCRDQGTFHARKQVKLD